MAMVELQYERSRTVVTSKPKGEPETDGQWKYAAGALSRDERATAAGFAKALEGMGIQVGYFYYDDVTSYYIWSPNSIEKKEK